MSNRKNRSHPVAPPFRLPLFLLILPAINVAFAVDQSKFRTCDQTSFCRRHRVPPGSLPRSSTSTKTARPGGTPPIYKINRESIQLVSSPYVRPTKEEIPQQASTSSGWRSFFGSTGSKEEEEGGGGSTKDDPYLVGPNAPMVSASLVPDSRANHADPSTTNPDLDLSVRWYESGVVRVRVTEPYGRDGYAPRWTSDELILSPSSFSSGEDAKEGEEGTARLKELSAEELQHHYLPALAMSLGERVEDATNYVGYGCENKDGDMGRVVVVALNPFAFHLFEAIDANMQAPTLHPPLVSVNSRQLLHFEHYRKKAVEKEGQFGSAIKAMAVKEAEERRRLAEDGEGDKADRHGGKEIVGYWENGLAIYADGTREELSHDTAKEEEAVDAAVVEEQHQTEVDTNGMWEEKFSSHSDSKPLGPSSVGMDITFPQSEHLYGLPEHASSTKLKQTNTGKQNDGSYTDPYRLYNLDVFEYDLDVPMALYGSVPLVISHTARATVGAFWFNPTETFVDVTDHNQEEGGKGDGGMSTHWMSESGIVDLFLLPGPNPPALYSQYAELTGYVDLPPMFALGYHQCRWNYRDEKDVYQVHAEFENLDYPYDVLWLDIEHTDGKRYFTWDNGLFPNPVDMQNKLASQGRKMVTIVDPHVKRDNKYYVHKEAEKKGLYIKDNSNSKDYDGWCWPGSSSYPDFTDAAVRSWWADQFHYHKYIGSTDSLYTWNDMNEPSVFNGPEVSMQKDLLNLAGIEHRQWHNLYGMMHHQATRDGLIRRNQPHENERPFVLTRSFFAGTQKLGAIWTGDNAAEWSHLHIAAPMLLSLNVAGLSFVGADVGGFFGNPDAELMTRWVQAGAYQPFFRGHAHHDSKRREPWMFGEETMVRLRRATMARYALLPYFYTLFHEASTTGMPVMRTMWMQYPTVHQMFHVDDQWLLGADLLIKPVTAPGVTQMDIDFPPGDFFYDVDTMMSMPFSTIDAPTKLTVHCDIDKIPVYQRGGSVIPRKLRLRRSTQMMTYDPYTLYVALDRDAKATGKLYVDDEHSFDYRKGEYYVANFNIDGGMFVNNVYGNGTKIQAPDQYQIERIFIMGMKQEPKIVQHFMDDDSKINLDFNYHTKHQLLLIRKPLLSAVNDWKIQFA